MTRPMPRCLEKSGKGVPRTQFHPLLWSSPVSVEAYTRRRRTTGASASTVGEGLVHRRRTAGSDQRTANCDDVARVTIYCDGDSDEIAAESFLLAGPLGGAEVRRLPTLRAAPEHLRSLLNWERIDWAVTVDDEIRCTVELSRHGYTGDNGFQRFARLYRSASLGIPTIYFTPFSRTRLNELDAGQSNARNVAPELFKTLADLQQEFGVACLAVNWPVNPTNGQPAPLQDPTARPAAERLAELVAALIAHAPSESVGTVACEFPELAQAMAAHASISFRGTDTRNAVRLPIEIGAPGWVYDFLPESYFRLGKAEKALASLALDSCADRPPRGEVPQSPWWRSEGSAWVLYLGYQWRPDPSCGLIALTAAQARARALPLIVVWPRVFVEASGRRAEMLAALERFKISADGPLANEMRRHGRAAQIAAFSERVSTDPDQFGVFNPRSKIGRILEETADAVVLGDAVLTFARPG